MREKYKNNNEFREKRNAATKRWALNNKEKILEKNRRYAIVNYEKLREKRRINPPKPRKKAQPHGAVQRKYKYGITQEYFEFLISQQNGLCAVCFKEPNGNRKILCIDHDHDTGKIRGLLCHKCNSAIGLFNDNIVLIEKALIYLKSFNTIFKEKI